MIKFLLTGLFRDSRRSRIPIIIVTSGVMLTIVMHAYINGLLGDFVELNAKFTHGHVKIMTNAYYKSIDQIPNDMAILGVSELVDELQTEYPAMSWSPRIQFAALVDAPDSIGETRSQGPGICMAMDFLSDKGIDAEMLGIEKYIVDGSFIQKEGEVVVSDIFADNLAVKPGDVITVIGTTMYGAMAFYNFTIAGIVDFGTDVLDRSTVLVDLEDARSALDMEDAAGEILGFFDGYYNNEDALETTGWFNGKYGDEDDEFAPVMVALGQQPSFAYYIPIMDKWTLYISSMFILAMGLVLWNAGLLAGIRRYGEFGIRLAMGEEKGHVYKSLVIESVFTGIIGTVTGTALGLFFSWLLQKYGLDYSGLTNSTSMMLPNILRAHITPSDFFIGFIPGVGSTVLGTMLAGRSIYKRETANLFKELEN